MSIKSTRQLQAKWLTVMRILYTQLEKVSKELFERKYPAQYKKSWKIISVRILAYGTVHQNIHIVTYTLGNIFYSSEKSPRETTLALM